MKLSSFTQYVRDPSRVSQLVRYYANVHQLRQLRHTENNDYSLTSFDAHHCIFVHIPKAAGVSVTKSLFGNLGGGHTSLKTYKKIFSDEEFAKYFKFTFVRNPWDRLLSAYRFLKKGGMNERDKRWATDHLCRFDTFTDFVSHYLNDESAKDQLHLIPQTDFILINGGIAVDFIGRVENIASDYLFVADRLGIQKRLVHKNTSGHAINYREHYTTQTKQIVRAVYKTDIELLGYEF